MKEIEVSIEINASAEKVWRVLTDFAGYPEWNPFIIEIEGEAKEGSRLAIKVKNAGGGVMGFRPKLLTVKPNRELRWLGQLWGLPGVLNGDHPFLIEENGDAGVRFVQKENFTGVLVPFLTKRLRRDANWGFNVMNEALKKRVEKTA